MNIIENISAFFAIYTISIYTEKNIGHGIKGTNFYVR
mgnify:CR=1 FL=1|jgi:hypothetical protein